MRSLKRGLAVLLSVLMIITAYPFTVVSAADDVTEVSSDSVVTITYDSPTATNGDNLYYSDGTTVFEGSLEIEQSYFDSNTDGFALMLCNSIGNSNLMSLGYGSWTGNVFNFSVPVSYISEETYFEVYNNSTADASSKIFTTEKTVVFDNEAPVIAVTYNNIDSASKTYYNNAEQAVTITITEENFDKNAVTATVEAKDVSDVTIGTVDTDAIEALIKDANNWTETSSGVWENTAVTLSDAANYTITIDNKDLATNSATQFTDSICVDKTAPEVSVKVATSIGTKVLEAITFGLYNADATATVTIEENISPLVSSDYQGVKRADNTVAFAESKAAADLTLSGGKATYTFTVDNDFDGFVVVSAKDSAGNEGVLRSKEDGTLVADDGSTETDVNGVILDKIAPNVSGELNAPVNDVDGMPYYNSGDVVYTITVTDEHFDADATTVNVVDNNDNDVTGIAVISPWNPTANANEYQATVTIPTAGNDGIYQVKITAKDIVSNNKSLYSSEFTIDTIAPEIAVAYNNIDSASKTYYNNADQAVTVKVTEENFDKTAVTATVEAKDVNGDAIGTVDTAAIKTLIEKPDNWTETSAGVWENTAVTLSDEANYTITIDNADLATNPATQFEDEICVDKTAPDIKVEVKTALGTRVLQAITFGLYNANATATVTATDKISPVTEITLKGVLQAGVSSVNSAVDESIGTLGARSGYDTAAEFTIPAQFRGFIVTTATDSVPNTNTLNSEATLISTKNTDDANGILIDTIAPAFVSDEFSANRYTDSDNVLYYGANDGTVTYTVTLNDANFNTNDSTDTNIYSDTVITVVDENDADVTTSLNATVGTEWSATGNPDEYSITITIPTADNDGKYRIKTEAKDAVGNSKVYYSTAYFVIDTYAPVVTDFSFKTDGDYYVRDTKVDGGTPTDNEAKTNTPDVNQYEYYFQEDFTVTVNATDVVYNGINTVSGIKDIILVAYDVDKAEWATVDKGSMADDSCEFTVRVDGEFRGNIYACAVDNLDQYPTSDDGSAVVTVDETTDYAAVLPANAPIEGLYDFGDVPTPYDNFMDHSIFVSPNDSIVEDAEKHSDSSSIKFTLDKTSETEMDKDSYVGSGAFNDKIDSVKQGSEDADMDFAKPVPLYNKNANVKISVEDTYSGIRQIDWYVMGRDGQDTGSDQSGTLTIDNAGSASGDEWNTVKDSASNLVYSAEKTVTVKNDSNDIIVLVVLTDRAGNKSYDYTVLGIDKQDPVINVSYADNNARTGNYNDYYNHDRAVTVTIKERNFDAARVVATIRNTDSAYSYTPNISDMTSLNAWSKSGDSNNPTYSYTINYTSDGTFKFDISCKDRAGNSSSKSESEFTIDKTAPVISVSLSNSDVQNTRYFKADRTATITVVEHNFNSAEFENLIKATLNGNGITVPSVSEWSRSGDNNTATVTFSADGDYVLEFKYEDMAGNTDQTTDADFSGVSPVSFTVDKTIPVVNISGISNNTAYSTVPAIRVTETDNNCFTIYVTLTGYTDPLTQAKTENFTQVTSADHLLELIYDLQNIAEDGFYTISVYGVDMAGNQSATTSMDFSKNENGSVFVLSSDLRSIVNKYRNKADVQGKDLYIDEYSLVPISDAEYYINLDGRAQSDEFMEWVVIDDSPENGWYHYRYIIHSDLISAEGEYSIFIRSTVHNDGDAANVFIINNDADKTGDNRCEAIFSIDNTNPYVKIDGLEKHVNNRTTEKEVTLTVNEANMYYIYVEVAKSGATDNSAIIERHLWVSEPENDKLVSGILTELGISADNVQVESYNAEDSTLPVASFTLDINNAGEQDVTISVVDLADNKAHEDEDYNKDQLFTDASSSSRSSLINATDDSIILTQITLSKTYAIGQMIKDNKGIAIGILIGILVLVAIAIIIPVANKRRKDLEAAEAELDDEEDEE